MLDYVKTNYSVEIKEVEVTNLGLTKELVSNLETDLFKKERLLREQLRFLEALGDIQVYEEKSNIFIDIISENAERVSIKVDNLISSYTNAMNKLPKAYKALAELEVMLLA